MNSKTQHSDVDVTNMISSVESTGEQRSDRDRLPEPVVAAVEQHDNILFGSDGDVEFPHLDDDTPELKFLAYFDDPTDDKEPYKLGETMRGGPMFLDGKKFETPRKYVFNTYTKALEKARSHGAALDLYEGGMVIMFVPGATYSAEVYPEHAG